MAGTEKVHLNSTGSNIIKEEFIIPDDPVIHINQEVLSSTSCDQVRITKPVGKREKDFVKKIKNRIDVLNKIKSSDDVEIIFEKSSVASISASRQAETLVKKTSEKSSKSRMKTFTSPTISILKSQATIKNSNAHQNLENHRRRGAAMSILKIPKMMDEGTTITISDLPKNNNIKTCLQAESVLKSSIKPMNSTAPLILKLTETSEDENVKQIIDVEKDKPTLHVLSMNEKQIVIRDNNFTEIKKEVIEANIDEQIANRCKRYYHGICFTCRKLKAPNDQYYKCQICSTPFQYECMRCRDVLTSKEEYFNHLKDGLYCLEIHVPAFLWNDSYALATRAEKHQCSDVIWERTQKLITIVREARAKLAGSFRRIKSCCPICDTAKPIDRGNFWCTQCSMKSVFKCLTCNRSYATYCSAIYHTENRLVKIPIFECNDCPFRHRKKGELITHIRNKHKQMKPRIRKKAVVYQCPDCHLIITRLSYWRKHAYTCREKVYYKCTLCTEKYLAEKEIMVHLSVAHEMAESKVAKVMKGIEQDRNNQEEMKKQKKQGVPKLNNKKFQFYRCRFITPYCIKCDIMLDKLGITKDNNCTKCQTPCVVQCKLCKKFFQRYRTSYEHIRKCEKIRKAKMNEKTDISNVNVINNVKAYRIVNKNIQPLDLGNIKELKNNLTVESTENQSNEKLGNTNNQLCHPVLDDEAFMSNENGLEINLTFEENEMQLDENNHVELVDQDIKVFDGLINFDNFEVIIPD